MKISVNTGLLFPHYTAETEAVRLLAKCGFDAVDLSMADMWQDDSLKLGDNALNYVKELKTVADGCGVVFNQAHAPFHSSFDDENKTAKAYEIIKKSMEFASVLGIKNIVVHPKHHLDYPENKEILREMNFEFYSSLLPCCKEYDINILVENMWIKHGEKIVHSVCATPNDFREYIDMMGSPYIKACLDLGHTYLVNEDAPQIISALGDSLYGLHVHDAMPNNDLHTVPYFGAITNWDETMKALADIDYKGDLTFEIKQSKIPNELLEDYLKLIHGVGVSLVNKFEAYR